MKTRPTMSKSLMFHSNLKYLYLPTSLPVIHLKVTLPWKIEECLLGCKESNCHNMTYLRWSLKPVNQIERNSINVWEWHNNRLKLAGRYVFGSKMVTNWKTESSYNGIDLTHFIKPWISSNWIWHLLKY